MKKHKELFSCEEIKKEAKEMADRRNKIGLYTFPLTITCLHSNQPRGWAFVCLCFVFLYMLRKKCFSIEFVEILKKLSDETNDPEPKEILDKAYKSYLSFWSCMKDNALFVISIIFLMWVYFLPETFFFLMVD